jgi:hypothetical protein
MPNASGRKGNPDGKRLAAIDQLLMAGMKLGPAKKQEAVNKVLALVPEWTRLECWQRIRHLRNTPKLVALDERRPDKAKKSGTSGLIRRSSGSPWTPADDDRLLNLAGYEPVKKIAHRLGRSERAVRFRLGALGMSAKVTDGWSLRALRKLLRVGPARLRHLIGNGMLRVRDPRISASSLAALCDEIRTSLDSSAIERIAAALATSDGAYSWDRAANLLDVPVTQVQAWISASQLRVVDTFVTDRSFEEFCKKHGDEINMTLIDPSTAKWLVREYGVTETAKNRATVSPSRKHALVSRTCQCGRQIAGNPYFRHVRACRSAGAAARGDRSNMPKSSSRVITNVQSSKSTKESASLRQSSKDG